MDQPKFKFGDMVNTPAKKGDTFSNIRIEDGEYHYLFYPFGWVEESRLELYQEPKKKKLYAYKFYMQTEDATRLDFYLNEFSPKFGRRAPEYDLEYPSEEVK